MRTQLHSLYLTEWCFLFKAIKAWWISCLARPIQASSTSFELQRVRLKSSMTLLNSIWRGGFKKKLSLIEYETNSAVKNNGNIQRHKILLVKTGWKVQLIAWSSLNQHYNKEDDTPRWELRVDVPEHTCTRVHTHTHIFIWLCVCKDGKWVQWVSQQHMFNAETNLDLCIHTNTY